ncbi:MAG: hypothetical protein RLZZ414_610 [Bacteroidota bacterium]|jgi:hypothetical protein
MGNTIYALYNDDHVVYEGAKKLVKKGVKIKDVFSPFPIHGIDPIIGVRKTRLAICAFIYGLTGMSLAILGMWYFMIEDWPMNIGGKPNYTLLQNLPAFVPVIFEITVLCTAHGMILTYFLRNETLPGMKAKNPDPRTTDDMFAVEIELDHQPLTEEELVAYLKETGAVEINKRY